MPVTRLPEDNPSRWPNMASPEAQYQKYALELGEHGSFPDWLDFYTVGSDVYVNVIFRPTQLDWLARHDLSGAAYQELYDEHVKRGPFKLKQVDSYVKQGQLRYAVVLVKGNSAEMPAYHGVTAEEHQQKFEDLTAKGYVPMNIAVSSLRLATITPREPRVSLSQASSWASLASCPRARSESAVTSRVQAMRASSAARDRRTTGISKSLLSPAGHSRDSLPIPRWERFDVFSTTWNIDRGGLHDGRPGYDVFLSHTSADKDAVEAIARRLEDEAALSPFLDKWHLIPGNPWQEDWSRRLTFLAPARCSLVRTA